MHGQTRRIAREPRARPQLSQQSSSLGTSDFLPLRFHPHFRHKQWHLKLAPNRGRCLWDTADHQCLRITTDALWASARTQDAVKLVRFLSSALQQGREVSCGPTRHDSGVAFANVRRFPKGGALLFPRTRMEGIVAISGQIAQAIRFRDCHVCLFSRRNTRADTNLNEGTVLHQGSDARNIQ